MAKIGNSVEFAPNNRLCACWGGSNKPYSLPKLEPAGCQAPKGKALEEIELRVFCQANRAYFSFSLAD